MITIIYKLRYALVVFVSTTNLFALEANIEENELGRIFHSEALLSSWTCRLERASNSHGAEKNSQLIRLTEFVFRYWFYSRKGIIERDTRFENLLETELKKGGAIPKLYWEEPIRRKMKSIPGFRWTLQEYKEEREKFKAFVLDL